MPEDAHHHGGTGGSSECLACPVCVLLQAVTAARPEVTGHLLAAGRELTLALKAMVDDHALAHEQAGEPADEPLRRIDID